MGDHRQIFKNALRCWKWKALLLLLAGIPTAAPGAGMNDSSTVNVAARVLIPLEMEAVDEELSFGIVTPAQSLAEVDPVTGGERTAAFKITGSADFAVQISYPSAVTLESTDQPAAPNLSMTPLLSGRTTDSQSNSTSLFGPPANVALSEVGEYFIWVGGRINDLTSAEVGSYEGSFTITVDYDL